MKGLTAITASLVFLSIGFLVYSSDQLKSDYINLARKSVVKLTNLERTSGGTGFYLQTPQGKVVTLTNAHVCGLAKSGIILSTNGADTNVLEIQAVYENHDLCILTAPESATPLKIASSVRDTEEIFVLGHPHLEPKSLVRGQVAGVMNVEIVVGVNLECKGSGYKKVEVPTDSLLRIFGIESFCVRSLETNPITANTLPGNSGSPVLNGYGHVVGVLFAGREGSGRGYIVPLEYVQKFLEDK